jgi:hypothetical protein
LILKNWAKIRRIAYDEEVIENKRKIDQQMAYLAENQKKLEILISTKKQIEEERELIIKQMNEKIQLLYVSETKLSKATSELKTKNQYIQELEDKYVNKSFNNREQQTYEFEFLESRIKIATVGV